MYKENVMDGGELKALCQQNIDYVAQLTEEDLSVLINELIMNQDTQEEAELLEYCFAQLELFDGYSDDIDHDKLLAKLDSAAKQEECKPIVHRKKPVRIWITAAIIAALVCIASIGVISASGRFDFFQFDFDSPETKTETVSVPSETTYTNTGEFQAEYPDVMMPEYMPEGYTFYSANVLTLPSEIYISVQYIHPQKNIFQYDVNWSAEGHMPVVAEADEGSDRTVTQNGITYNLYTNCGDPGAIFQTSDGYIYMMGELAEYMSAQEMERIVLSFE